VGSEPKLMHEVATLLHHPFSILPLKNLDTKHESGRFFLIVPILQTLHSSDPLLFLEEAPTVCDLEDYLHMLMKAAHGYRKSM
jgi:hypothetical protein